MAYCVRFLNDNSYSEIPDGWLIDETHCWWPKTKNPVFLMSKEIDPENDPRFEVWEVSVEKRCANLQIARQYAADSDFTENENSLVGKGKRKKKCSKVARDSQYSNFSEDEDYLVADPPPKISRIEKLALVQSIEPVESETTSVSLQSLQDSVLENIPIEFVEGVSSAITPVPSVSSCSTPRSNNDGSALSKFVEGVSSAITPVPSVSSCSTPRSNNDGSALNLKIFNICSHIKLAVDNLSERLKKIEEGSSTAVDENLAEVEQLIPLKSKQNLDDFESLLDDELNVQKFISLIRRIGGRDGKDYTLRVLRRCFSNELATQCSWLGQRNNLKICDLRLIRLIKRVVTFQFKDFKEHNFDVTASEWFRQAKLRFSREKK